jgi:DNA repair protein RecO (recombination protein O)
MARSDTAICLRVSDFSETSQVAAFLTRAEGLVRVLAKGSKRKASKTGGRLDLFSEGRLVWIPPRGEGLGTLTEFAETVVHTPLRRSRQTLYAGMYLLEVVGSMLGEHDPHPEVFDLLHNALGRLGREDALQRVQAVVAFFQWRLLHHAGLLGQMHLCCNCGADLPGERAEDVRFSSTAGGLLCGRCAPASREGVAVGPEAMAGFSTLRTLGRGGNEPPPPSQAKAVNRVLAYHIACQGGRPLRMSRHLLG